MKKNYLSLFLLFIIAAAPFSIEKKIAGVWITSTDILVSIAVVAWIIKSFLRRQLFNELSFPLLLPIGGLIAVFSLSVIGAINQIGAISETIKYVMLFLLFYVLVNELNEQRVLKLIPFIVFLSASIVSVWFLYDFFTQHMPYYYLKDWDRTPFGHIHFNLLASYLTLSIPFGFYLFIKSGRIGVRIVLGGLIAAQVIAILFTYSRINWIVAAAVITGIITFKYTFKGAIFCVLMLAMSTAICSHILTEYKVKERAESIFNTQDGSLMERRQLSSAAITLIEKRPFLGIGLNNFSITSKRLLNLDLDDMVHNIYLQFWVEAGVFALLLLIMLTVKYYYDALLLAVTFGKSASLIMLLIYSMISFSALLLSNQFGDPFVRMLKEYFVLLLAMPYAIKRALATEPT